MQKHQRKRLEGYILKDMESYITFKYITFFLIEYVFSHLSTIFFCKIHFNILSIVSQLIDREYRCSILFSIYRQRTIENKTRNLSSFCFHLAHLISFDIFTFGWCQICLDITANELLFLIYFREEIFWPQTNYNLSCWPNWKQKSINAIFITRKLEMIRKMYRRNEKHFTYLYLHFWF